MIQFSMWGICFLHFRDQLTKDDIKVYAAVLEKPGDSFPSAAKWYDVVSSHLAARYVLFLNDIFSTLFFFLLEILV